MLPSLLIGILVFIFILLMAQALRYTEFVLVHGVGIDVVARILLYLSISFLPALFPMSLLFAVVMAYGRLSNDSEIVALKASGMSMIWISLPAILMGSCVALVSAQTSFHVAPWGNRQFELLVAKVASTKATATIREGTFSEGFFDKVVYANQVDSKTGKLKNVFIYDEKQGELPITIIAKTGEVVQDPDTPNAVLIRLHDGDIHRKGESHTKIKFDSFDLKMVDPIKNESTEKSPQSLTINELSQVLDQPGLKPENERVLRAEYHKRWAVSVVCVLFGFLGVGLGTNTNKRSQKSGGLPVVLGVVVFYWILYVSCEGLARSGKVPPALAIWLPNFLFTLFTAWILKRNWD